MEEDRERDELERTAGRIENLAERAARLERWAAGRLTDRPDAPPAGGDGIDAQARIGHTDGTVFRWDEASGQWIPFGRIEDPWTLARALAGREGGELFAEPDRDRFPDGEAVLDWWPTGDDTYRGTDGHRVEPPEWLARRPHQWVSAEEWRQALRAPREAAGPRLRTWNRQLEADWESRNRRPSEWVPFGEDGDGAEERKAVAGPQDGHGPYYWPRNGVGRLASLAELARWAASYRQAWQLEQGRQPPTQPVRGPLRWSSGSPHIDARRIDARRNVRWEWRTLRRVARSVRDGEARRFVVAVREAARVELLAAEWWLEPNAWQRIDRAGTRAAELGRWVGHEAALWWVARPRPFWNGKG